MTRLVLFLVVACAAVYYRTNIYDSGSHHPETGCCDTAGHCGTLPSPCQQHQCNTDGDCSAGRYNSLQECNGHHVRNSTVPSTCDERSYGAGRARDQPGTEQVASYGQDDAVTQLLTHMLRDTWINMETKRIVHGVVVPETVTNTDKKDHHYHCHCCCKDHCHHNHNCHNDHCHHNHHCHDDHCHHYDHGHHGYDHHDYDHHCDDDHHDYHCCKHKHSHSSSSSSSCSDGKKLVLRGKKGCKLRIKL